MHCSLGIVTLMTDIKNHFPPERWDPAVPPPPPDARSGPPQVFEGRCLGVAGLGQKRRESALKFRQVARVDPCL